MATTGYSGTPLIKKLGILPEMKIALINAPENYIELLATDITAQLTKNYKDADLIHVFAVSGKDLTILFTQIIAEATSNCIVWISWYKKAAKLPTDITEDLIRQIVLPTGWVDVKVCAVSDIWSGLKIVKRKK